MIPTEYKPLISKLLEKTNTRSLNWSTTSDASKYEVKIGDNYITIDTFTDFVSGISFIKIEILDQLGSKVDSFSVDDSEADYSIISDLYYSARRNALKIDETLADILKELDEI